MATIPANALTRYILDVVVCTTAKDHVLNDISLPPGSFTHHPSACHPRLLGFECHDILRSRPGEYDFYCFMEDDLVLYDPMWFRKIEWFNSAAGSNCLLMPNRYELAVRPRIGKVYIDGDIHDDLLAPVRDTASFRDFEASPELELSCLNVPIRFLRPRNPHSGCFFLTAEQMETWSKQTYFLDRDTSFVAPMASAASLGVMRTFRIYKPAAQNASFLEVEHFGNHWIRKFGDRLDRAAQRTLRQRSGGT